MDNDYINMLIEMYNRMITFMQETDNKILERDKELFGNTEEYKNKMTVTDVYQTGYLDGEFHGYSNILLMFWQITLNRPDLTLDELNNIGKDQMDYIEWLKTAG